ncbi:MAG: DivIVA domain-containing protein [Clostridia bacterium]|nr:DivIVA domain-containing protein [Clostridia bacterium]
MMLPNQINNQRFSMVGKGGYRASEVDAFIQRVFQNYNKLYNENNVLKERLSSISPLIDEYNENKRAIADALIWAKTTSDKTVEQAQQQAKEIIDSASSEGEKILADKAVEAQAVYAQELNNTKVALENAKTELEMTRNQAKSFSERYISEINSKATSIIEDANLNASKIVADAYKDAQTARDKADALINKANTELAAIKAEAAKLKTEIEKAVKIAADSVSAFVLDELEPETIDDTEVIEAKQIDLSEIEEFTLDFVNQEPENSGTEEAEYSVTEGEESIQESSLMVETVLEVESDGVETSETAERDDFISGGASASMPDVSAYISKIFDSAGSEDSDFTSFASGLDEAFAQSLGESDISFDELKMSMVTDENDEENSDE